MQLRRKQAEEEYRNRRSSEINMGFNQWLLLYAITIASESDYCPSDYSSNCSDNSYDYSSSSDSSGSWD